MMTWIYQNHDLMVHSGRGVDTVLHLTLGIRKWTDNFLTRKGLVIEACAI